MSDTQETAMSTDPDTAMSPAEAARRLAGIGHDQADAAAMVRAYLDEASALFGVPPNAWAIDDYDLAEIARRDDGRQVRVPAQRSGEHARADQLAIWHPDDHSATLDDARERG